MNTNREEKKNKSTTDINHSYKSMRTAIDNVVQSMSVVLNLLGFRSIVIRAVVRFQFFFSHNLYLPSKLDREWNWTSEDAQLVSLDFPINRFVKCSKVFSFNRFSLLLFSFSVRPFSVWHRETDIIIEINDLFVKLWVDTRFSFKI